MTVPQENQGQPQVQEQKSNDKEYNFRQLEAKYRKELEVERSKREEAEKLAREANERKNQEQDEYDPNEPYVDHKRLDKKLSSFERRLEEKIDKKAEEKARILIEQQKRESWIRNNPDFYDVLQHADKFAQQESDLADSILEMPESFERQKLVYKNIKALGLHKPKQPETSIQQKVDANRRSPYYQPSQVASAPYNTGNGDFSPSGQKSAYDKMKELQARLRI